MKKYLLIPTAVAAIALSAPTSSAQEKSPGKESDAVKEQPAKTSEPARTTKSETTGAKEPGKTSDAVKETSKSDNQFKGKITAVDSSAKMITVDGTRMLHIGETTKIKKANGDGTFTDLKVGDQVQGMSKKVGEKMHAETVQIGGY